MNGTALFLSMALPLGAAFLLPLTSGKLRSQMARDPVAAILYGIACLLTVSSLLGAAIFVVTRNLEVLEISMLATAVFAVAGIVFGLFRSLRGTAKKRIA